jgi:antibiotic biosynthesis monooxygenase (ABM) superfamily enzyme
MASPQTDNPSPTTRWLAPAVMTLAAWLVAWLVVAGLLTFFGKQLGSLPIGVRALVMSGLLVALMVNLVMPAVGAAIAHFESRRLRPRLRMGRVTTTARYKRRA